MKKNSVPQARHDVGRIKDGQTAEDTDGQLPDLKVFVVERDEEGRQVLRLRQIRGIYFPQELPPSFTPLEKKWFSLKFLRETLCDRGKY